MKKLIYILLLAFVFSCTNSTKPPIDKKTFVNMLVDIHTIDGVKKVLLTDYRSSREEISAYKKILDKYKIDTSIFVANLKYYSNNIQEYNKVYSSVIDSLKKRNNHINDILKKYTKRDTTNLWKGKNQFSFSKDSLNSIKKSIKFVDKGAYCFSMNFKLGKRDRGIKNSVLIEYLDKDSKVLHKKRLLLKNSYINYKYAFSDTVLNAKCKSISITILDCTNLKKIKGRDYEISDILFINTFIDSKVIKKSFSEIKSMPKVKFSRFEKLKLLDEKKIDMMKANRREALKRREADPEDFGQRKRAE